MKCISIGVNFSGRIARDCENVIIHTTSNRGTQPVDRCHTSRFKVSPSAQGDVSSPGAKLHVYLTMTVPIMYW